MRLIELIKKQGMRKGIHNYLKEWYKRNKILLLAIIIIILLGILPIFPSSSTQTFKLDVPYTAEGNRFPEYGIGIKEDCSNFYAWDDLEKVKIIDEYTIYQNNPREPELPNAITHEFRNYNIGIFAIKTCDNCVDEKSLSLLDEKTCLMNQSSVFGYFEKCESTKEYTRLEFSCIRIPFVISDNLEVVSPDKDFKVSVKPYVTKTRVKGDQYNPVINKFYVEIIVEYPEWKPLPHIRWIGAALLFILDPLRSILKYFTDKWFY